jgi:glucose/mannose transport system substrate-binding protein
MADWRSLDQALSCAHGSACTQGRQAALKSAIAGFSADGNVAGFKAALVAAAASA